MRAFLCDEEQRRKQNRHHIAPVDMEAVFYVADIGPRHRNGSVVQTQSQVILVANIDLTAGMTGDAGNGSTHIENPIAEATRLKQRRKR